MAESYLAIEHSEQMNEFAEALALAQGQMTNPIFDSVNPHFKNKYASLAAVRDAVIPPLAAVSIAVIQLPVTDIDQDRAGCLTMLIHKSGQYLRHTLLLPVSKTDIQGYCSAISYAQRYSLKAAAGVAGEEDDDGEGAINRHASPKVATANGAYPFIEKPKATDTSQSIWRETLRAQQPILQANWTHLTAKETEVLDALNKAISLAQQDEYYPDSKGLIMAEAALQWADKLEIEQEKA